MHKRNIFLVTLGLSILLSAAFALFPQLSDFDTVGLLYFPSILLSVVFSSDSHMPETWVSWCTFVVNTLIYWSILLVSYAFLLELYLFRKVLHHLDAAKLQLSGDESNCELALEKFAAALIELEIMRRKHFFLKNCQQFDLFDLPHVMAAKAIVNAKQHKPVAKLLEKLHAKLQAEVGVDRAGQLMRAFHGHVDDLAIRYEVGNVKVKQ